MTDSSKFSLQDLSTAQIVIITAVITVAVTILALEKAGMIKHPSNEEGYALSQYRVVLINEEEGYRMTHKPSKQSAVCKQGFLFIESDANAAMSGVLLDYKSRGIRCETTPPSSD